MSVTFLRWKAGFGGDTVLRILLESDSALHSQVKFTTTTIKTLVDKDYYSIFPYKNLLLMSTQFEEQVNHDLLLQEITDIKTTEPNKNWLFKSHYYKDVGEKVIDIVTCEKFLPFTVKARILKIQLDKDTPHYHQLYNKIKDPRILYKFDCYNYAVDRMNLLNSSNEQINLTDILSGWEILKNKLILLNFKVSDSLKKLYTDWLVLNQEIMPSKLYIDLIAAKNYDYTHPKLCIEERYCLMALAKEHFKILPDT